MSKGEGEMRNGKVVRILTASKINKCFAEQNHQGDVLIALYRFLYRRLWDRIDTLDGWPRAGAEVHKYVFECFIRFDRAHHRKVQAGGLWMSRGWSMDQDLGPWEVLLAPYTLKEDS